jgi:uncharacterized coiled-coil protein SlyX
VNETTEQRLEKLERKLAEYDALIAKLMVLAAGSVVGRKFLKQLEPR